MNSTIAIFYVFIITGLGLYFGLNKKQKQSFGKLDSLASWFALFTVLFPVEYLVILPWLGINFGKGILLMEVVILLVIPLVVFLTNKTNDKELTSNFYIGQPNMLPDNSFLKLVNLLANLLLKLPLVLMVSVYLAQTILFNNLTYLVIIIVIVAIYSAIGETKKFPVTLGIQGLLIISSLLIISVYTLKSTETLSFNTRENPLFNMTFTPWQIVFVSVLISLWHLNSQWQFNDKMNHQAVSKLQLTSVAGIKFLIAVLLLFAVLGYQGQIAMKYDASAISSVFVNFFIPKNLRWIVNLGILSIIMATLGSTFKNISTLFIQDFFEKYKPAAKIQELHLVRKLAIMLTAIISIVFLLPLYTVEFDVIMVLFELWLSIGIIMTVPVLINRFRPLSGFTINLCLISGLFLVIIRLFCLFQWDHFICLFCNCDMFQYLVFLGGITGIVALAGNLLDVARNKLDGNIQNVSGNI